MKILHVIETLGRGGAERLLVTLLPALVAQGHDVAVAVRGGPMDLAEDLRAGGVRVIPLPQQHRWRVAAGARALVQAMPDADVIHAHLYFPAICTAYARWLRLTQARSCVTFHNLAYAGATQAGTGLTLRKRIAGFLYPRGIDQCFAVSGAVAQHYTQALGLRGIETLPNPVDVTALQQTAPGGDGLDLVLPGRIVREKGHEDALAALALLRADGITPRLHILGDGPLRAQVEAKVAELTLSDQVQFAGALPHDQMIAQMSRAAIVLVPSRFEGFGITALEAMALARPVVASTAGGLPDTVAQAGVLVPAQDPAALAQAIRDLLADPAKRTALGDLGAARARDMFDLPRVVARLVDHYERLLAGSTLHQTCPGGSQSHGAL